MEVPHVKTPELEAIKVVQEFDISSLFSKILIVCIERYYMLHLVTFI